MVADTTKMQSDTSLHRRKYMNMKKIALIWSGIALVFAILIIAGSSNAHGAYDVDLNKNTFGQESTMNIEVTTDGTETYTVTIEDWESDDALHTWDSQSGNVDLQYQIPASWDDGFYTLNIYEGEDLQLSVGFWVQLYEIDIEASRGYFGPGETAKFFYKVLRLSNGQPINAEIEWAVEDLGLTGSLGNGSNGVIEVPLPASYDYYNTANWYYNDFQLVVWANHTERSMQEGSTVRVRDYELDIEYLGDVLTGQFVTISAQTWISYSNVKTDVPVTIEITDDAENVIASNKNLKTDENGRTRWVIEIDDRFQEGQSYNVDITANFPPQDKTESTMIDVIGLDEGLILDHTALDSGYGPGDVVQFSYWLMDTSFSSVDFTSSYSIFGHYADFSRDLLDSGTSTTGNLSFTIPNDPGLEEITFEIIASDTDSGAFTMTDININIMHMTSLNVVVSQSLYKSLDTIEITASLVNAESWTMPVIYLQVATENIPVYATSQSGREVNFSYQIPETPPQFFMLMVYANDESGRYIEKMKVIIREDAAGQFGVNDLVTFTTDKERYKPGELVTVTLTTLYPARWDSDFDYSVYYFGTMSRLIAIGNIDEDELDEGTTFEFVFIIPDDAQKGTYVIHGTADVDLGDQFPWAYLNLQTTFEVSTGKGDEDSSEFLGFEEDSPMIPVILFLPLIISIVAIVLVVRNGDGSGTAKTPKEKKEKKEKVPKEGKTKRWGRKKSEEKDESIPDGMFQAPPTGQTQYQAPQTYQQPAYQQGAVQQAGYQQTPQTYGAQQQQTAQYGTQTITPAPAATPQTAQPAQQYPGQQQAQGMHYCTGCGKPIQAGWGTCPYCHKQLQ